MGGSVDKWSFIGKAELCFTKDIELIVNKALKKLNILCKLCGVNWTSRSKTLRSTYNTVIWHVLDEGALIWALSSTTVKSRLDTMQYRMFIIVLSAVSKINNQNAEQQCRPTSLERRHKFATVKFTNNIILEALTNTVYATESLVLGNIQQGIISLHLELFP